MLQIIVILIALGIICYLGQVILRILLVPANYLKDHLAVPVWLVVVVYACFILGILGYYKGFCSLAVLFYPAVIIVFFWFYVVYKQSHCYRKLVKCGIINLKDLSDSEEIHQRFFKNNGVKRFGGYLVYEPFFNKVKEEIEPQSILLPNDLQEFAIKVARGFQTKLTSALADVLQYDGILLCIYCSGNKEIYLTKSFILVNRKILEQLGCTTASDFLSNCPELMSNEKISSDSMRLDLSRNILSILVKKEIAELVKLSANGDKLYVAKNKAPDCQMKTVYLDLDDGSVK